MNELVIAIKSEMITLSLIKDELIKNDTVSAMHLVDEKLKKLSNAHTNLKINKPELLEPADYS